MFITTDENMWRIDFNERYPDFDAIEDIEILTQTKDLCVVRTGKLMPTLFFMQETWWRIWELTPDDEDWIEYNILTYYKPKKWKSST